MNGEEVTLTPSKVLRSKLAEELRESWQGRLLAMSKGKIGAITLVILANAYPDAMDVLMRVILPGVQVKPPCFQGNARISRTGSVVCNVLGENGIVHLNVEAFANPSELVNEYRRMADSLKLADGERLEMFLAIQKWITGDYRIKPSVEYTGNA